MSRPWRDNMRTGKRSRPAGRLAASRAELAEQTGRLFAHRETD
jgi:hypothetical protein